MRLMEPIRESAKGRRIAGLVVLALAIAAQSGPAAEQWNQWRGPARTGIDADSPKLADAWPATGPRLIWKNTEIPSGQEGGYGCLSLADGHGFIYVNWKTRTPIPQRKIDENGLKTLGWSPQPVPEELLKPLEEARLSEERAALKGDALKKWIDQWVADHVKEDQKKDFGPFVSNRLTKGRQALAMLTLEKLAMIKDKEFPTQDAIVAWFNQNGIESQDQRAILKVIPTTHDTSEDVVACVSLTDGKTVWKKACPGRATTWGSSCTPCVVDGRCYAVSERALYCFDARSGEELWKAPLKGKDTSSSPAVVDGVVVVLAGQLRGFDVKTGKELWTAESIKGENASPALWTKDGKTYLICNGWDAGCVDPRTGKVFWTVPGGGNGTAAIDGDIMLIVTMNEKVGLVAYRMSLEKAEKLWDAPISDRGTTPILHDGHAYIMAAKKGGAAKTMCLSLADGQIKWEQKVNGEIASPVLADGKLIGVIEGGKTLLMFRATPEKYEELARIKMGVAAVTTPVLEGGRMYLRLADGIGCFDLVNPGQ